MIIYPRKNCREDVGLKTGSIELVVLKELARRIRFAEYLQWHYTMRPIRQLSQPILQRHRQLANVAAVAHRCLVRGGCWVSMTRRRRLFRVGAVCLDTHNKECRGEPHY